MGTLLKSETAKFPIPVANLVNNQSSVDFLSGLGDSVVHSFVVERVGGCDINCLGVQVGLGV